jgi:amino acid adenylation domain-containing protein
VEELSYAELDQASDAVVSELLAVGASGLVGLLLSHDAQALVAILGVLKAGAAYVPLDIWSPAASIATVLEDAAADLVLTDRAHLPLAQQAVRHARILLVEERAVAPTRPQSPSITPDTIACVYYTSGSTGSPKGVVHTQATILETVRRYWVATSIGPQDRVALIAPFAYAASVTCSLGALLTGALCLPFDLKREGISACADFLAAESVTVCHTVPTTFRQLAQVVDGTNRLPRLRIVNLGGDATLRRDVELYREKFSDHTRLLVSLASSETFQYRFTLLDKHSIVSESAVPLVDNAEAVEVLLIDEFDREVAPGQVGEIVVCAAVMSPGYWRRPDLTRAAFTADPRTGAGRVFRTGDVGRMLPDGRLVHVGRTDHQVKIRGFRVEPGAIEAVLREQPEILEAAILAPVDSAGDRRLVAYVVPRPGTALDVAELRRSVRARLPAHMLPSEFVCLAALPLNARGKLDRRALAAMDIPRPAAAPSLGEPHTATEAQLLRIWRSILNVESVGRADDFFALGGESLLALNMLVQVETVFGIRLPLASVFPEATIEGLARLLDDRRGGIDRPEAGPVLVPIQPLGSRPPFYCVHPLDGEVLRYAALARHLGQEQPFYGLRAPSLENAAEPLTDITAIAARYVEALVQSGVGGPYYLGGFSFGGLVAFEVARQLEDRGQRVALLALLDCPEPVCPPNLRGVLRAAAQVPLDLMHRVRFESRADRRGRHLPELAACVRGLIARRGSGQAWQRAELRARLGPFSATHFETAWANQQAVGRYRPGAYRGSVTLFRAEVRRVFGTHEPGLGWSRFAQGGVQTESIPGFHEGILTPPNVRILAQRLDAHLARARAPRA